MKTVLLIIIVIISAFLFSMLVWQRVDQKANSALWHELSATQPVSPALFDPKMVEGLPPAAQRYFRFAIKTGTPLYTVAEISMKGRFSLGTKEAPNYMAMTAKQILAAPTGFIWKMSARNNLLRISGSDATNWTRFWLMGVVPVAHMGGDSDHTRSAFGRYIAEAVFWTPAALLPGKNVRWTILSDNAVRVLITHNGMEQSVDLTIDETGKPTKVSFPRWSNANPEKIYQIQPFGGYLSKFKEFEGFRLPTHIEAGNQFGTDDYFPFFVINVANVRFPNSNNTQ
ncbi:MAG: hypothetical protein L3J32_07835 [Rhizobiaceae bacterium]|nr:hypothetical protein [Rhizobiaceae bacterium]